MTQIDPHPNHHPHSTEDSYQERIEKLVALTVGVSKEVVPSGQIRMLMYQIVNGTAAPPEIRAFTQVLLKIIDGERDPAAAAHLPHHLAQAIASTIAQIEAPLAGETANEAERVGLTLPELLARVGEACTGNVLLWRQLWTFTEELEQAPTSPPEMKALAVVIRKILAGERQKHITEVLPADLADMVGQLLDQMGNMSVTPPPPDI